MFAHDGYMVRFKRRGTKHWFSAMDEDGEVRFFKNSEDAHAFKEDMEQRTGNTHTYNVYPHDASAK